MRNSDNFTIMVPMKHLLHRRRLRDNICVARFATTVRTITIRKLYDIILVIGGMFLH